MVSWLVSLSGYWDFSQGPRVFLSSLVSYRVFVSMFLSFFKKKIDK